VDGVEDTCILLYIYTKRKEEGKGRRKEKKGDERD
jgi:hypothetical protein